MADIRDAQKCFIGDDGYMYCNFVVRNGKVIKSVKGWIRFFVGHVTKQKTRPEV